MTDWNDSGESQQVSADLRSLRARIIGLESKVQLLTGGLAPSPAAALSPSIWQQEIFPARITVDHQDGTYDARRQVATACNAFADDSDDTAEITLGNVAERGGYTGALAVADIVLVRFDGLTAAGEAIYHAW